MSEDRVPNGVPESGINWQSRFVDALEVMHPNTKVTAGQVSDSAGHLAHEWRAMQAEARRLAEENARLHSLVAKLTDLVP